MLKKTRNNTPFADIVSREFKLKLNLNSNLVRPEKLSRTQRIPPDLFNNSIKSLELDDLNVIPWNYSKTKLNPTFVITEFC